MKGPLKPQVSGPTMRRRNSEGSTTATAWSLRASATLMQDSLASGTKHSTSTAQDFALISKRPLVRGEAWSDQLGRWTSRSNPA